MVDLYLSVLPFSLLSENILWLRFSLNTSQNSYCCLFLRLIQISETASTTNRAAVKFKTSPESFFCEWRGQKFEMCEQKANQKKKKKKPSTVSFRQETAAARAGKGSKPGKTIHKRQTEGCKCKGHLQRRTLPSTVTGAHCCQLQTLRRHQLQ